TLDGEARAPDKLAPQRRKRSNERGRDPACGGTIRAYSLASGPNRRRHRDRRQANIRVLNGREPSSRTKRAELFLPVSTNSSRYPAAISSSAQTVVQLRAVASTPSRLSASPPHSLERAIPSGVHE